MARRNIDPADLVAGHIRRGRRQQNALNLVGDLKILVNPLFLSRFRENKSVIERKRGLFGNALEDFKGTRRERLTARLVGHDQQTQLLRSVDQRTDHR